MWLAITIMWASGTITALACLWRLYGTHYIACLLADRLLWWMWAYVAALAITQLGRT